MDSSKKALANLRKQCGKSQQALGVAVAKKLKRNWSPAVAQRRVSNWEHGTPYPTDVERKAIAKVLGVSLEMIPAQRQRRSKSTALFEELAQSREPVFVGICFTSKPIGNRNPSILLSMIKGVRQKLSFAMFVPSGNIPEPPSDIRPTTESSKTDYAILSGYINGVWKEVEGYYDAVRMGVREGSSPGDNGWDDRLRIYEPIKDAAFPFPPSGSRYCLILRSKPDLTVDKELWLWVHTADENKIELVEDDTTQEDDGNQRAIWEAYFSDVITHWRKTQKLPVDGGLWKACKSPEGA